MRLISILFWIVACCSTMVVAQSSEGFRVEVPVVNRTQWAHNSALESAFKEAVVRASGTQRALDAFYVQESFKKAASFLTTFEYITIKDRDGQQQLKLVFNFNANAIQQLLLDAAVPMWSGSQPLTMMWIAYEQDFDRNVVSSQTNSDNPIKASIKTHTDRRGLPFVFPLMDLEDSVVISASDIWGRFPDPVLSASTRYGSDAVVAGRIAQAPDGLEGRFLLNLNGRNHYQDFRAENHDGLMGQLVDWLSESLCDIYCVTQLAVANNQWQLLISDVGNFASYRKLMDYLEKLSAIRKAEVVQLKGRYLLVAVDLVGEVDSLMQAIDLDKKLIAVRDSARVLEAIDYINAKAESKVETNADQSDLNSAITSVPNLLNEDLLDKSSQNSNTGSRLSEPAQKPSTQLTSQNLMLYIWRP